MATLIKELNHFFAESFPVLICRCIYLGINLLFDFLFGVSEK